MTETHQAASTPDDWDQHWEDFGGPAEGNPANGYRQRLILRQLGQLRAGARLLDIGSGQGELALLVASTYPEVEVRGIEYSREGVRRAADAAARRHLEVRFSQRDLLSPAEVAGADKGWATHAVCSEVLEHLDFPELLLRNAKAYLAPGCLLVVTVPGGPRSAFDRHIGHRQHFTPTTLRRLLEASGFQVHQVRRAGFPFFNVYRLSVIARGRRLIDDLAATRPADRPSLPMRLALRTFDTAFRLNLASSPFGWQLVAVATPLGRG